MTVYYEDASGNVYAIKVNAAVVKENTETVKQILRNNSNLLEELKTTKVRDYNAFLRVKLFSKIDFSVNHVDWSDVTRFIQNGGS